MRQAATILLMGGLAVGSACATGGERTATTGSRDVLTAEEIGDSGTHFRSALEVVEQLRPHFLRTRPNPTAGVAARRVDPIVVYVNGTQWGGPESLARIRPEEIVRIRFVRPSDATTRYGMNHGSGAIEVVTVGG